MAPRTKRKRSNDGIPNDSKDDKNATELSRLKQHESLWMEDGSIVLATDVHLYRVHKSILARNSSVFKDILDLPVEGGDVDGDGAGGERWDGLPVVRMAGDDDAELYHLLMSLYDRDYFRAGKCTTFPILLALLNLSSKYDVPIIRREVIHHIELYYPSDPEKWNRKSLDAFIDVVMDLPSEFDFLLLAALRRCDVRTVLPAVFYECATGAMDAIMDNFSTVTIEDFGRIITGRERLCRFACEFGSVALFPHVDCGMKICTATRANLLQGWIRFKEIHEDKFSRYDFPLDACAKNLDSIFGNAVERSKICIHCESNAFFSIGKFRKDVSEKLPIIFGLDDWETKKRTQI